MEIFNIDCFDQDGIVFLTETLRISTIKEEEEYNGVRVSLFANLYTARIPVQIDIGFGDAVIPTAEEINFPTLLDAPSPQIKAYSRYTVVAEKTECMIKRGIANSRMKDYYDICVLSRLFKFDYSLLKEAIYKTMERRETPIPENLPPALSETFFSSPMKEAQWTGFIKKAKPTEDIGTLKDVIQEISPFILPLLDDSLDVKKWNPGKGWI